MGWYSHNTIWTAENRSPHVCNLFLEQIERTWIASLQLYDSIMEGFPAFRRIGQSAYRGIPAIADEGDSRIFIAPNRCMLERFLRG
jgi:hypothetical protein